MYAMMFLSSWPYWLVYFVSSAAAIVESQRRSRGELFLVGALLFIFVAARREVGGDWHAYVEWLRRAAGVPLSEVLGGRDIGYAILNWAVANSYGKIYIVNTLCSLLSIGGLAYFCSNQKNPVLAITVAIPYLIFVVFMGYTRQGVAIGLGAAAIAAFVHRRFVIYVLLVLVAASFHKAALIYFVFAPLALEYTNRLNAIILILTSCCLFSLFIWYFRNDVGNLIYHYWIAAGELSSNEATKLTLETGLEFENLSSKGAVPRLAQALFSVAIIAMLISQGLIGGLERRVWTLAAVIVVCLFFLAFYRSTLADRMGLFFYPLQLVALSNLSFVLPSRWRQLVVGFVLLAMAASFGVWLCLGRSADNWLPYQSMLGA